MKTLTDSTGKKHLFSVPITQDVTKEQREELKGEKKIALRCPQVLGNAVLAVIENPVFYDNRKEEISTRFFGTFSHKHPKIERILVQGDFLVSGSSMRFVRNVEFADQLDQYRITPAQVYAEVQRRNADAVYAF
jgi:3'-phosphoadenosine 5'-phosphosulfate synthase